MLYFRKNKIIAGHLLKQNVHLKLSAASYGKCALY
jgi:hypothetical protein